MGAGLLSPHTPAVAGGPSPQALGPGHLPLDARSGPERLPRCLSPESHRQTEKQPPAFALTP